MLPYSPFPPGVVRTSPKFRFYSFHMSYTFFAYLRYKRHCSERFVANSVCVCCVTTSTVLLRLGVMRSAYAAILDLDYAVLQAEVGLGLASPTSLRREP